jgi:hypothetical protein
MKISGAIDLNMTEYDRGVPCDLHKAYSGTGAVFILEDGASLRNVSN